MTDRGLILRNTYPMIRTVSQNNSCIRDMIFELKYCDSIKYLEINCYVSYNVVKTGGLQKE